MRPARSASSDATASSRASTFTSRSPSGTVDRASAQFSAGDEEDRRAVVPGADHLLGDAADGADLARVVDGPGAGDELAAGQRPRRQLVDDAEREHQPGARAADVLQRDLHRERVGRLVARDDADDRAAVVRGGRRGHRRRARCLPSRRTTIGDRVARLVRGDRGRAAPPRRSTGLPSTETITSPLRSFPADGEPAGRSCTTTVGWSPGCRARAAPRSWRSPASRVISAALCCSASLARLALGVDLLLGHDRDRVVEPAAQRRDEVHAAAAGPPSTDTVVRSRWPLSG